MAYDLRRYSFLEPSHLRHRRGLGIRSGSLGQNEVDPAMKAFAAQQLGQVEQA